MRLSLVVCLGVLAAVGACGPDARNRSDGGPGSDGGPQCVDGMHQCLSSTYEVCSGGQWTTQQDCPAACDQALGCVECIPNSNVCEGGNVHSCSATGEIGPETMACTGSTICQNGACVDACEAAATSRSYTGCEYWAVDLDNAEEIGDPPPCTGNNQGVAKAMPKVCMAPSGMLAAGGCDPPNDTCPGNYTCQAATVCVLDAQHAPFAIVVSNPQSRAVDVTVTAPNGATFMASVPAGQVQALLPQAAPQSIPDQSIDGGGIQKKAYKVTSSLPIVAYQFNPLDNSNVFSNDASLLIPRTAFDVEYYALSKPSLDRRTGATTIDSGTNPYLGYLAVVAWQDGTMVEVTPKVATLASNGTPAIAAGVATTFTLNAHDVLSLQAAGTGDLTGSRIRAVGATPAPIGVFSGHEATVFGSMTPPSGLLVPRGPCCADHLEDMMFPTSTWGKTFAIARSQVRIMGYADPDLIRIMAQKAGTTVQITPAPTGTCNTLGPGQYCEVSITADTVITANEPILVGHFLQADIWQDAFLGGAVGEGDPSMAVAVPTEQFRNDYAILVPSQYAKNFLSISANATGAVTVDGTAVTLTANGTYRAARVPVTAGAHKILCPGGCGVEVYGYGPGAVSYMFAGGLDLKQIVIQ